MTSKSPRHVNLLITGRNKKRPKGRGMAGGIVKGQGKSVPYIYKVSERSLSNISQNTHYLAPFLKSAEWHRRENIYTLLWVEKTREIKSPKKSSLDFGNCFKDRGRKSSLTTRNIFQIRTDESVRRRPKGGCLDV